MTNKLYTSKASTTRLINLRNGDHCTKYIGRRSGHPHHYGNPFVIGVHGSREEVVKKCDFWLRGIAYTHIESRRREWILQHLLDLDGEVLGCWCTPLPCHGDIYIQLLKEIKERKCIDT